MSGVVIGVDLGGTKIAAAIVDGEGRVGEIHRILSPAAQGPDAVLDAVAQAARMAAGGQIISALGIGTAGAVDTWHGIIVSATQAFPNWVGTNLVEGLRARLGQIPVVVYNDVDAHLLGEAWCGAARGVSSALMVAAGTGIGGAVMIGGQLVTGAHHLGGEIGHMPAAGAQQMTCTCGRAGHLEAIAAGPAILRHFLALGGDDSITDTRVVVARADTDPLAKIAVEASATALGRAIAGIATTLDPELVIIGGGLGEAEGLWWDTLVSTLHAEVVDALTDLPVLRATLGQTAAIVGASAPFFPRPDEEFHV